MDSAKQLFWLFVLAIPIACISWTVTNEELFRQIKESFVKRSHNSKKLVVRKFFYMLTCEYCFSHYITIFFLFLTGYQLLLDDWRGYLIAGFSLVWIANIYMSLYSLIRTDLKKEKIKTNIEEKEYLKTSDPEKTKAGKDEAAAKTRRLAHHE
jgi:hypothetical protein